ncbi:MAG: hypothetical protein LBS82_00230 [Spirochaetaceae bacterium]|jgi:hypothetical protein|nr:hypothetical protein [Spirochaetaceae bacterium]
MEFNPLSEFDAKLSPEDAAKARALYEKESLKLKLRAMRKDGGAKTSGAGAFNQPMTGSKVKARPRTPRRSAKRG